MPHRSMPLLRAAAGSALALIGSVAVLEAVLRARFATEVHQAALQHPPHPFLQVVASSQVSVNRHGFRGDPIDERKPPRTFRVFALGGSTTMGVGARYEDTYPFKLQAMLRQRYPDVAIEVQNAGSAWYTTAHLLINYQLRVRPFEPDLIVVFEAINDLYRSFSPPWWAVGEFKPDYSHYLGPYVRFLGPDMRPGPSAAGWQLSDLLVWRRLRDGLLDAPSPYRFDAGNLRKLRASLRPRTVETFKSFDSFRNYYELLVRNIQDDRRRVVMASQPFIYSEALPPEVREALFFAPIFCAEDGSYPTMESMVTGMRMFNRAARAIAESKRVPFLDFEGAVPKTRGYFLDDFHLTGPGNEILARMVFDWIVDQGLIGSSGHALTRRGRPRRIGGRWSSGSGSRPSRSPLAASGLACSASPSPPARWRSARAASTWRPASGR